jgi:hypothetical protein
MTRKNITYKAEHRLDKHLVSFNVCTPPRVDTSIIPDDDDVYLEYYSGKRFHINYSCLHVLRKTHKIVQ